MQRRSSGAGRHVSWEQHPEPSVSGSGSWLGRWILFSTAVALSLSVNAPASWAQDEPPEWSEFRTLIEINGTDGDAGFQIFLDGDDWESAIVRDPNGKRIYQAKASASTREQGLTENFFESAEPSCVDDPLVDFVARFPEGTFTVQGKSTDKVKFDAEAVLTHDLPAIPEDLSASGAGPITLEWTWPGPDLGGICDDMGLANILMDPNDLFGFQVIVEREDPEPLVVFSVELGSGETSVVLPENFTAGPASFTWEVIAIGAGADPEDPDQELAPSLKGNQVIAEDEFCTNANGDVDDCDDAE